MAITFIAATSAEATSVTLPSHATGDLLIIHAHAASSVTITIPSGWTSLFRVAATNSHVIAIKTATSASEVSGTWTNAIAVAAYSYRGGSGQFLSARMQGVGSTSGTGTTITHSANGGNAWINSSAWSLFFASHATIDSNLSIVGTGMTLRHKLIGSAFQLAMSDSNAAMVDYTGGNLAVGGTSAVFRGAVANLAELPITTSGGAIGGGNLNGGFQ